MQLDTQQAFRRILLRNITLPLVTGLISGTIFVVMINLLVKQNKEVEHTDLIISQAYTGLKLFVDGETGLRGFALTGKDNFLEPYTSSKAETPVVLKNLKELVGDNKIQLDRVTQLENLFESWHTYAENLLKLKSEKKDVAILIAQGLGKTMMDGSRDLFGKIIANEERLRKERSDAMNLMTNVILSVVVVLSLLLSVLIALYGRKQLLELSRSYQTVLDASDERNRLLQHQQWLKTGQTELNEKMVAQRNISNLLETITSYMAQFLKAQVGAFYRAMDDRTLVRSATYAYSDDTIQLKTVKFGETLIGQAAVQKKVLHVKDLPSNYLKITSATGSTKSNEILLFPVMDEGEVLGVLELGFLGEADRRHVDFYEIVEDSIAVAINTATFREQRERLLKEIQNQSEEMQTQQEELRVTNEELEEQTRILKSTQVRLEAQHAEMEQTNEQLEEQARTLEVQKDLLDRRNELLTDTKQSLESKAIELQRASQYKSEFLANMSHELRTPLNSSLILAKLLADNKDKNLSDQQVEFAKQISSSGNDLLNLINDILDLSKVESGKLDIHLEDVRVETLINSLRKSFEPIAQEKKLKLNFQIESGTPEFFHSDQLRVEQVLKNLLSNSLKFTAEGSVNVRVYSNKTRLGNQICFDVKDTGIGIKKEQQEVIFEAFRQADGTTNRKFGGTGLGLSISRDLARLLGGQIEVQSTLDEGSTFTFTLPEKFKVLSEGTNSGTDIREKKLDPVPQVSKIEVPRKTTVPDSLYFQDDRDKPLERNERYLLVVEDDPKFARIIFDLAHEQKYKCIVTNAAEEAYALAKRYLPAAVILDMKLSGQNGLFALDQLKQSADTRHIPVHVVSGEDFSRQALHMGAIGYMIKPVKREQLIEAFEKIQGKIQQDIRKVLVVEDNSIQRNAIQKLIEDKTIETIAVENGADAIAMLGKHSFDCMIMDLNLPDMTGFDLIEKMNANDDQSYPPIIVYTGRSLSRDEEMKLNRYSHSIIIKGAKSPERLLDEVTLFLHRVEARLDGKKQDVLENLRNREMIFDGKTIMIVDDDMRNTFALTAALEQKGAHIVIAKNGEESLAKLATEKVIDIVLMDIMMPVMDGYEAIRHIRKDPKFRKLPIIALTAKAMKDDRQLCLEAGANDYLSKPVDLDKLLSLIRIWITAGRNS